MIAIQQIPDLLGKTSASLVDSIVVHACVIEDDATRRSGLVFSFLRGGIGVMAAPSIHMSRPLSYVPLK